MKGSKIGVSSGLRDDAISFLPDELLAKILSLVPTKLAASTSVLSKTWRNVFPLVLNPDFDDTIERCKQWSDVIRESFKSSVDRTLALHNGSPIKNFSLIFHIYDEDRELPDVHRWICNAVKRGVVEMSVSIKECYVLTLPCELFLCKTLVKLTIGTDRRLDDFPDDLCVCLPSLKFLCFDSANMCWKDLCNKLLPGCPLLEELDVSHTKQEGYDYCISSKTIKKLKVYYECYEYLGGFCEMSFDAPSLVYLDYCDYTWSNYPLVNFESLVEARIDLCFTKEIETLDLDVDVTALIVGIRNVKTLHLSPGSVDVIFQSFPYGLVLPVFNNLVSLSFGSKNKLGWKVLPCLLEECPKLETLIIQGLDGCYTVEDEKGDEEDDEEDDDDDVTLLKVKELHVLGYGGSVDELEHLKSLLEGSEGLELLRVEFTKGIVVDDDANILQKVHSDLTKLLGSKCKIVVVAA